MAKVTKKIQVFEGLDLREAKFCAEFLVDMSATKAAIRAGYAESSAGAMANALLGRPAVVGRVLELAEEQRAVVGLKASDVLRVIAVLLTYDPRQLFDSEGDIRAIHELSREEAMMIQSFEVVMKNATAGDGKVDRVLKVKLADRAKYVELAAKHFGLLVERVAVYNGDEQIRKLEAGNRRLAKALGQATDVWPEPPEGPSGDVDA